MREIAEGVFELRLGYVNAHLVVAGDGLVLVDTELPRQVPRIEAVLGRAQRTFGDVHTVLVTHNHRDHVGSLAQVHRRSGARVVAHAIDAAGITDPRQASVPRPLRLLGAILKPPEPAPVDEVLAADGPFSVPGFTAIHTPGHTAGHVSYLLERAGGILFAGDAAAGGRGGRVRPSPRIVTDDRAAAASSVARLAGLTFDVAVFGHGRAVTGRAVDRFRELAAR